MTKVYLPHYDNGMDYSDHSNITFGKAYANLEDAIQFLLNGFETDWGEFEQYIIVNQNFFDDKWHEIYGYNEKVCPYLFKPNKNKLPDYDYRRELEYEDIGEHAYIEILDLV